MVKLTFKVGTRRSQLARIQTDFVINLLKQHHPDTDFESVIIDATADKDQQYSLFSRTIINVFTKELEKALVLQEIDLVVHSCKDIASFVDAKIAIGAILKREDARDVVVMKLNSKFKYLKDLPPESVVGTSSVRRISQLKRNFPSLIFKPIRGNLNTRLRKLDTLDQYECLILAAAGLHRLQMNNRISEYLDTEDCMFAPAQGALAVQCRFDDKPMLQRLRSICDFTTTAQIIAERSIFKSLNQGCVIPLGVSSKVENSTASVVSFDGGLFIDSERAFEFKNENDKNYSNDSITEEDDRMLTGVYIHDMDKCSMLAAQHCGERLSSVLARKGAKQMISEAILRCQSLQ